MNDKDHGAAVYSSNAGLVQDSMENPLWTGTTSAEDMAVNGNDHRGVHSSGEFPAAQFPIVGGSPNGDFRHQRGFDAADSAMRPPAASQNVQHFPRQDDAFDASSGQQTEMMNAYIEKFTPVCPPYPVGTAMGYYSGGGPPCRGPTVLPDIDLSHRPGSLQEAICMYIDYLMAENELRTRISECPVASPPPPLDFHREEYYRDVMCRPVNFPTARFRDWLKRYNVDIEITDPDGQTVSQTTFAPITPVTESSEGRQGQDGSEWSYVDGVPAVSIRRRPRSSATQGGVICHGGGGISPRPVQLGPASLGHPLLHLQAESQSIPVEMLSPLSDESSIQSSANFQPPSFTGTGSLPPLYQAQPPPPHPEPCVPLVGGCAYRSLQVEEEEDTKEELPSPVMPVSGWPDMTLERPESSRAGAAVDSTDFEEDASDQTLDGSSADTYFQDGGETTGGDGNFDSRCFASDVAAAANHHWTAGVIRSPVDNRSVTDVDPTQDDPANLTHSQFTDASPDHAGRQGMDISHGGAFPVIIEPNSPSESCISTGNASTVQDYAKCFANDGSAGYQLPYEAGSDQELYRSGGNAQLSDAAAPESGTTTPPSHSTDTTSCLDLGSDFADLLGTQHSDEFDYHLNYANPITANLPSKQLTEDLPRNPRSRRARRSYSKPATMQEDGPARKTSRRESADH